MKKVNEILENNNIAKSVFIISFTIMMLFLFIRTIHTDEGFYHSYAKAKNDFGTYQTPGFFDAAPHQDYYHQTYRGMVQIYRLGNIVFPNNHLASIKFVRFINILFWLIALIYFLKTNKKGESHFWFLSFIIMNPLMLRILTTGRSEALISALFIIIISELINNNTEDEIKFYRISFLSFIMLLLHPNGILFFFPLSILIINTLDKSLIFRFSLLLFFMMIFYYLSFFDFYLPYYKSLLANNGTIIPGANLEEKKIISSIIEIPGFIWDELRLRYFQMQHTSSKFYIIKVIGNLLPITLGIYFVFKKNKKIFLYILSAMIFFIFLGNKYNGYLIYFLPIIVFYTFKYNKNLVIDLTLKTLIILFLFYNSYRISDHIQTNIFRKDLIEDVKKIVNTSDFLYANFKFEPYLVDHCNLLTLGEKTSEFYIRNNLPLNNSYVLDQKDGVIEGVYSDGIRIIKRYENYVLFQIDDNNIDELND